jgi:FkbM family methyltransferase
MSHTADIFRRFGNELYKVGFPIYRPLYSVFKIYADRAERQILTGQLSAGCVAVDAGANIGIYSQFLSRCVGPAGAVHSFEPSPENFRHLSAAVAGLPNVRTNELAVSDKTGRSLLYVSDKLNVDHHTYPTEGEARKAIPIKSTTLDDYFAAGSRVDLIKMDVQGFELHALRGAKRVLQENRDVKLQLEFWPFGLKQAGASADELLSFLEDHSFSLFRPGANGLVKFDRSHAGTLEPAKYFNLFAEREPATRSLR